MNKFEIKDLYSFFKQSDGIVTDSRAIRQNTVFFALKGKNFDGNKYAANALEKGAIKAVVDDPSIVKGPQYILVEDVLSTLQLLAKYHRRISGFRILAITGSNGKTTTKELIKNVLGKKYSVMATQGNLNNHIGVPLTLLNFPQGLEIGIVEMGANHPGEIKNLCEIAEPDYGIITNVGKAHLEGFGSLEGVAKAKAELYIYLSDHNGALFVNGENERLIKVLPEKANKTIYYGNVDNSVCYSKFISSNPFVRFKLVVNASGDIDPVVKEIQTRLIGSYNIENAVAASCIGLHFGIHVDKIKEALENYTPSNNRSELIQTSNNTLILDAYNANPTSMKAAIDNFLDLKAEKKLLILGEMLELGNSSDIEHRIISDYVIKENTNQVIFVGTAFKKIKNLAKAMSFNNVGELIEWLKNKQFSEYNILIKGSRGNRLEEVIPYL